MEAWSTLKGTKKLFLFQDHLFSYFQLGFFQPNIPGTAIGSPPNSNMAEREETLKEVWHEIFIFKFFHETVYPGPLSSNVNDTKTEAETFRYRS